MILRFLKFELKPADIWWGVFLKWGEGSYRKSWYTSKIDPEGYPFEDWADDFAEEEVKAYNTRRRTEGPHVYYTALDVWLVLIPCLALHFRFEREYDAGEVPLTHPQRPWWDKTLVSRMLFKTKPQEGYVLCPDCGDWTHPESLEMMGRCDPCERASMEGSDWW